MAKRKKNQPISLATILVALALFGWNYLQGDKESVEVGVEQTTEQVSPVETTVNIPNSERLTVSYDLSSWEYDPPEWSISQFPDYVTEVQVELDRSSILAKEVAAGSIYYDELDDFGRSGIAYGVITKDMVDNSKGEREKFERNSEPSGWYRWFNKNSGEEISERMASVSSKRGVERKSNNEKTSIAMPNGKVYNGYFYNRSHQIADALGGRAYRNNLVTGTRFQNVGNNDGNGGFRYVEKIAIKQVENSNTPLHYFVKPYYVGSELVPRGSLIVMFNDEGFEKIHYVFNEADGYTIDYSNGSFSKN